MGTVVKTIYYGARIYFKEDLNTNPDWRQLSTLTNVKVLTRTRTGVSLPKYKQLIANHQNATTALSGTFCSLDSTRGRFKYTVRTGTGAIASGEVYGDVAVYLKSPPGYVGGWSSKADSRAASSFLKACRQAQVAVSGPTFLGEIRDVIRMFRKPAGALQDGIRRYTEELARRNAANKQRYFRKEPGNYLRNLSHIASGLWLERSFGWIPLLADIQGARDAYNNLLEIDRVIAVSGGGHDAKGISNAAGTQNIVGGGYLNCNITDKLTEHNTVRYRGAVRAQAVTTAAERFAQFGFTPSEFLPTAWEVLPWSFLLDYFVNIGDMINGAVTDTSNVAWVCKTVINKADFVHTSRLNRDALIAIFGSKNLLTFISSPGFSRWRTSTVSRSASAIPVPSLIFYLPKSDNRLLNIASLMTQVGIDTGVTQQFHGKTWRR